jgi:hypothetical protein
MVGRHKIPGLLQHTAVPIATGSFNLERPRQRRAGASGRLDRECAVPPDPLVLLADELCEESIETSEPDSQDVALHSTVARS